MASQPVAGSLDSARATGRLGMWIFLVTDAISFAALLIAYGVLRARSDTWPAAATWLDVPLAAIATFVLLGSSLTMALAVDAADAGRARAAAGLVAATGALGLVFLGAQAFEYAALARRGVGFAHGQPASTFYACTGWHGAHLVVGLAYLAVVGARRRPASLRTCALFWQFLDAMWILIFTFVYLA
jgi:cytochrome c oxidase subunit III